MTSIKIGIIGGTGLDNPQILENKIDKDVTTPYGKPSDKLLIGKIDGVDCVLLSRHGRQHTILPSNINYRANIWALKEEGCTHVIVSTACGSLQEHIKPGDFVIIDQFIDRTYKRDVTFYDGSKIAPAGVLHLPMDAAFCSHTRRILADSCKKFNYSFHPKGTAVTVEGPRFSSCAESKMFQMWGGDVVNMTTVPEVVLAKELGLCYASIAMATDYDCWKEGDVVSTEKVLQTFRLNVEKAVNIIKDSIKNIASQDWNEILNKNKELVNGNLMLPK